jgi:RsiW-degrading membrane proteinase PrsW (M82 family)
MTPVVAVISAVPPGIFWLWVFTKGKSYRGSPLKFVILTFFLGMLSTAPAAGMEWLLIDDEDVRSISSIATIASVMFFIVGPVEETSKYLAVRAGVYNTRHLREPLDGLIYGAAAALGFATAENVVYALSYGPEIMIVRGPLSTVAHLVFGAMWAVTLDRRQKRKFTAGRQLLGLAVAATLHGAFNVLVFTGWGSLIAIPLIVIGAIVVTRMFRWSREHSTYHLRRNVPSVDCGNCGYRYRVGDNFCLRCGALTTDYPHGDVTCSNCKQINSRDAKFCTRCGDLFVKPG